MQDWKFSLQDKEQAKDAPASLNTSPSQRSPVKNSKGKAHTKMKTEKFTPLVAEDYDCVCRNPTDYVDKYAN